MKALILWGIGMSGGIAVAAGLFTFLVITGIPHRLMTITHTTAYGGWYEWMFVLGGALGNAVWLTDTAVKIPAGMFLAGAAGLLVGILIMVIQTFGVFKLNYALNRMHAAAMGDSLGIMMIVLGMMVIYGISFASLKLLTVLVVFWFASPVCSHLLAKLEVSTNEQIEDECEVPKE